MIPTAIVFDLGKVLVDFDWTIAGRRIAARSRRAVTAARFVDDIAALMAACNWLSDLCVHRDA